MKRSEVVVIISDFLAYELPQDRAYLMKYSKDYADSILEDLEAAGMLPPKDRTNNLYNGDNEPFLCEWEDEDEV